MSKKLASDQIRHDFIDSFAQHGHTAVLSISLVPGWDSTLLITNPGMA
jgi:alanyl-tRNA synthetase